MRYLAALLLAVMLPAACTPPPPDAGGFVDPSDPHLRYTGRFDARDPARPVFDWPATTIEAAFDGTSVAVRLADGRNDYNVYLDGAEAGLLRTTLHDTLYTIAQGLPDTVHTLRLVRRTEASLGPAVFLGLVLDPGARLHPLPPRPVRRIEFIGDSITCGYGNEGAAPTCDFSRETENSERAYAALTARRLGAEYVLIAYSGKGAVRNYGDAAAVSARPLPDYYGQATAHAAEAPWDPARWTPHAVVVNLGTNDFSTAPQPPRDVFIDGYGALFERLRAQYPEAHLFAVAGPLMQPPAAAYIRAVVERRRRAGDTRIHFSEIKNDLVRPDDFGCNWHPNVAGHLKMADQFTPFLADALGWNASE